MGYRHAADLWFINFDLINKPESMHIVESDVHLNKGTARQFPSTNWYIMETLKLINVR